MDRYKQVQLGKFWRSSLPVDSEFKRNMPSGPARRLRDGHSPSQRDELEHRQDDAERPYRKVMATFFRLMRRRADVLLGRLLPRLAARRDLHKPELYESWEGPFNGQRARQALFADIIGSGLFDAVVETGTFRGTTTAFMRKVSGLPVYTIEANRRFFHFSRQRFLDDAGVRVVLGRSPAVLHQFAEDPHFPHKRVFFYLDAHWGKELPLNEELHVIATTWTDSAVMIDDFQVPDDAGYGFDKYQEGISLTRESIHIDRLDAMRVFWPAVSSTMETGMQRGCVLLASTGKVADSLERLTRLRLDGRNP